MSVIRLHDVTMKYEDKPILREVFFRLEVGDRVGLIGRNGSGKSTLLKLALGEIEPSEGTVTVEPDTKIGYFSQFSELDGDVPIAQVLDGLFDEIHAVEDRLAEVETAMGAGADADELDRLINEQADLLGEMERLGGWDYARKIETVLTILGFSDDHRTRPVGQLSGGWRNRAALAKIILEEPDVLLLDEPTNFLDVAGVEWLENWFRDFRGGLIVVSHDRQFLDGVVNRIVDVENLHTHEYEGNFTDFVIAKQFRLKTLERQFVHEAELLAYEAEGIADRKEAAKDPSRALKRKLANVKKSVGPRPVDQIITEIYRGLHIKDNLCRVEGVSKAYDGQQLFQNVSFEIRRRDRIAILGPNGSGKTTLLNVVVDQETPDEGEVMWARGSEFAFYNTVYEALEEDKNVSHAVNSAAGSLALTATKKSVNRFLAMFQFSETDLKTKVGNLSGGQRARVAIAQCLLSGASTIILDEPTNHLDVTSTQVMERALQHFPGAVVVVSHDRFFIDKVATRHLVFEPAGEDGTPGALVERSA